MTKQEYEELQSRFKSSGKTLKEFLNEEGVAYSTYNYWRKKAADETEFLPMAPIEVRPTVEPSVKANLGRIQSTGVMIAFPNGVRARFGSGSEGVLMEVLNRSMNPGHVLP